MGMEIGIKMGMKTEMGIRMRMEMGMKTGTDTGLGVTLLCSPPRRPRSWSSCSSSASPHSSRRRNC